MSEYKTYTIVNIRIGPGFSHDFVQIAGIFQRRCEMERGSFLLNFRFKKMNYFIEYYLIHSINRLWVVSDQIFCYIRSFKNDSLKWKLKKNIIQKKKSARQFIKCEISQEKYSPLPSPLQLACNDYNYSSRSLLISIELFCLTLCKGVNPRVSLHKESFFRSVSSLTARKFPVSTALWIAWILAWNCFAT